MRLLSVLLVILLVCCSITASVAGSVADRVKARGFVRCGSTRRPGLADTDGQGRWTGLNVDVCRGIAAAVLGSPGLIEYHEYETPKQFDAVRTLQDDVYFLTGSEIDEQELAGKIVPGPTIFVESHNVMVPSNSAVLHVGDLAGSTICFLIGSLTERSLSAYFDTFQKSWLPLPFSEVGEMNDAYNVQRCRAIAGEITNLAAARLNAGENHPAGRILSEPLSVFPVIAATGTSDAQWSAIVSWTVITLISSERHETRWYAGSSRAMPITAPELGLDKGWQGRVLAAIGNYADIFERHLGEGSQLKLDRGLNADQSKGGLLLCPFLE